MIDKQELRHNNLVKDRGGKTLQIDYFEVDKVCQKVELQFGQIGHPLTEYFDYLEPIVLTADILENQFGFICVNRITQYYKKYLTEDNSDCCYVQLKQVGNPIWIVGFIDKNCMNPYKKDVEYVHQLQNLWFMYADCELKQPTNKEPFCKCLYEDENNLPRTHFCFMACQDQFKILAQRKLNKITNANTPKT